MFWVKDYASFDIVFVWSCLLDLLQSRFVSCYHYYSDCINLKKSVCQVVTLVYSYPNSKFLRQCLKFEFMDLRARLSLQTWKIITKIISERIYNIYNFQSEQRQCLSIKYRRGELTTRAQLPLSCWKGFKIASSRYAEIFRILAAVNWKHLTLYNNRSSLTSI